MTMTRRRAALLAIAVAPLACSDPTQNPRDQLNLDRPVDVAFACFGGLRINTPVPEEGQIVSAMPMTACDIRSRPPGPEGTDNIPGGQDDVTVNVDAYAFILQSVPGTVGVAQFPTKEAKEFQAGDVGMLDSDPLTPGKNGISVGSLPVAIATDKLGCTVVTANAGSCDLSFLDVNSALQLDPQPIVNRVAVTNALGDAILAKPAAMVAEPAGGTIGERCPADGQPGGIFYVAYPACHLVAAVNGTGRIVGGIQFDAAGVPTILPDGNVTCPAECGTPEPRTDGPHPVSIDLLFDKNTNRLRMAIASEDSNTVTVAELDDTTKLPLLLSQVSFDQTIEPIGIIDVALSQQIGMGGSMGVLNDNNVPTSQQFQFVYAVATDGTVRVADVLALNRECDTQIDPRYLHDITVVSQLSCLPLDEPTLPRRVGARGPGIELPGDGVPTGVTIVGVDRWGEDDGRPMDPNTLIGYFAAISASNGALFFANVDDDFYKDVEVTNAPLEVAMELAIAHQLRDAIPIRDQRSTILNDETNDEEMICETNGPSPDDPNGTTGGPRIADPPTRFINTGFIGQTKTFSLPAFRGLVCTGSDATIAVSELAFTAPDLVRERAFPDIMAMPYDETWTLVWEGNLSGDTADTDVDGPPVRHGLVKVDGTGMRVEDPSRPFCAMGVESRDLVVLRGCEPSLGDGQCGIGYTCYVHPDSQVSAGTCLLESQVDFLSAPCRDFLVSSRRYSVASSRVGELKLMERARVLRTTPLTGCTSSEQCDALHDLEVKLTDDLQPFEDSTVAIDRRWACEADPTRAGTINRCVMKCDTSDECDVGTICNQNTHTCVEGPVPPLQCLEGLQRYEVRASDAFAVIGTRTGYQHPIIMDPTTGACVRDPDANPLQIGRLPLVAPACTGDGLTDTLPNPCTTTVEHAESVPNYIPGTCEVGDPTFNLITRPATALRFRNAQMTFHLVDPEYLGDFACKNDRLGWANGLPPVPTVFPGLTIELRAVAGFAPQLGRINATFPSRVVRGPQNSIWVVDEGDYLSTSTSQASTRGKVFRIESVNLATVNTMQ